MAEKSDAKKSAGKDGAGAGKAGAHGSSPTRDRPLRVVVTGAAGRMGSLLVAGVKTADDLELAGATEREGTDAIGLDAGLVAGCGPVQVAVCASLEECIGKAEVVIDFTHADASIEHVRLCADRKVPLVLGSTGFSAGARTEIAGRMRQIPIVMAPNMSVGVNLLFRLAGDAAKALGEGWDAEILEVHHRHKKDAPSGTALRLCEVVADRRGLDPERDAVYTRRGITGARPARSIGIQTLRGGDVVGEHTVLFLGDGERLEITHRATNRANFAAGALRAARWVVHRPPGLYDMLDVLGLSARVSS